MLELRGSYGQLPLSLSEVKAHLRLDTDAEDGVLENLALTATEMLEAYLGKTFIQKEWAWTQKPTGKSQLMTIALPMGPLIDVIEVTRLQENGNRVPIKRFRVDRHAVMPTLWCQSMQPVEVLYRAGFGAVPRAVPAVLRQALFLFIAHLYENRTGEFAMPPMVKTLIQPYRCVKL